MDRLATAIRATTASPPWRPGIGKHLTLPEWGAMLSVAPKLTAYLTHMKDPPRQSYCPRVLGPAG